MLPNMYLCDQNPKFILICVGVYESKPPTDCVVNCKCNDYIARPSRAKDMTIYVYV